MYLCKTSKVSAEKRALAWLRKLIHPYCWGTSDRFKEGFSQTSKAQILNFFLCLRLGIVQAVPADAQDPGLHVAFHRVSHPLLPGVRKRKTPETLVLIDIDCHSRGSFEGAVRCVEWLRRNGFPGLFWCRSTNGRGIHAYLVVRKLHL